MTIEMPRQFGSWFPLTASSVEQNAPTQPAAVQIRVEHGLVDYAGGRSSAMVMYFYASQNARNTLQDLLADELAEPGVRGEGPLLFRYMVGEEDVLEHLKRLLYRFYEQFYALPLFNQPSFNQTNQSD